MNSDNVIATGATSVAILIDCEHRSTPAAVIDVEALRTDTVAELQTASIAGVLDADQSCLGVNLEYLAVLVGPNQNQRVIYGIRKEVRGLFSRSSTSISMGKLEEEDEEMLLLLLLLSTPRSMLL